MMNRVHVDEKWFYLTQVNKKLYLLPEEESPVRTCHHKGYIIKVMFLAAVARPRHDEERGEMFDGKLGIWPFVEWIPAQRNSVNRPHGTLEMKPVTVTRDVYRQMLVQHVIPAIKTKWPARERGNVIYIQQDNARPHVPESDPAIEASELAGGWCIKITNQPAQSPDMNVLDLGFFNSIQSLQYREAPRTMAELADAVKKAFDETPHEA